MLARTQTGENLYVIPGENVTEFYYYGNQCGESLNTQMNLPDDTAILYPCISLKDSKSIYHRGARTTMCTAGIV